MMEYKRTSNIEELPDTVSPANPLYQPGPIIFPSEPSPSPDDLDFFAEMREIGAAMNSRNGRVSLAVVIAVILLSIAIATLL
jgi:hypothetical protein